MQAVNFEEVIDLIAARDPRYRKDAYMFVREALDHTQRMIGKPKKDEIRHVSGRELLAGMREYALQQYGPMTTTVLEEWGVRRCEDFGELVFSMVESGLLAKTDKDTRDDFKNGYSFDQAFLQPFLPAGKQTTPAPEANTA
jgi:uncharacterized repeat protein (TIGR04138 family)